jgi:tetratricopeptide (TPR) repeat protein
LRHADALSQANVPRNVRAAALLVAGDAAYAMQSYGVAAARYGELQSRYRDDMPESARAALGVGWAELRQGHRDHARAAWTAAADAFPAEARAPLALILSAELASRSGDAAESRSLLDRIIRQYQSSPYAGIARLARSGLALRRQQEAEALRDLEEVVRVNGPSAIEERRKLGQALATPGAEVGLEAVLTGNGTQPHEGEAGLDRFATVFLNGRREQIPYTLHGLVLLTAADRGWADVLAGGLASRLVEDFPSYPPAPPLLARVATAAAASGQWPVARRAYETLLARAPAPALPRGARVAFAEALFRTGAIAEARAVAQSAAGTAADAPSALLLLAQIHEAAGERQAALGVYDRLLREHPRADRSPSSLLTHAQLLEESGQAGRTAPVLRRLVEVSGGEVAAEAAYRLAQSLRAEGQHAAAVEWYLTAAYVADGSRWARMALLGAGSALTALGETTEALAAYRKLLPARPGVDPPADREASGEASYRAGEILSGAGLHEEALDMFVASAHFTTGLPAERRALVGVVRCLVATGDRASAEAVYRRLLSSGSTEPDLLAQARTALRAGGHGNGSSPPGNGESARPKATH